MKKNFIKVGNAQGFWGDNIDAPARLVAQQPDLDYLTMDYLSEVSMAILSMQKEKDPLLGYPQDFLGTIKSLIPFWKRGSQVKLIANAGGLNPLGCARKVADILNKSNLQALKIGVVSGDDVLTHLKGNKAYPNMDTTESIDEIRNDLISANAYLGAQPIVEALLNGATIVITGRVADPSLTVACCVAHFGWKQSDYEHIAGATVAGHLIECGTQATGGISTHWLEIPDPVHIGFPVAEISENGSCVITKPLQTGGLVNEEIIKEQLLYEIGDPDKYISPDACVSFLSLRVQQEKKDRVRVWGAKGASPPSTYKVSATYRDGYRAEGMLTLFGRDVIQKAQRCGNIVIQRVREAGYELQRVSIECLGCNDILSGVLPLQNEKQLECVLRIVVQDKRRQALECFSKELAPLVTSGPQGTTGYFSGRPKIREAFGYWPCLIDSNLVVPHIQMIEAGIR